jgi:hypothetical protein
MVPFFATTRQAGEHAPRALGMEALLYVLPLFPASVPLTLRTKKIDIASKA